MSKQVLVLVLACTAITMVFGQDYQPGKFKGELNYQILYPIDFDPYNKYPLLLFLHGAGERGEDNQKQLVHGSKLFLENLKKYPAIYLFPQCPKHDYWANVSSGKDNYNRSIREFAPENDPTKPMQLVLDIMDSLSTTSSVDPSRIYVGGLSMGGMGTFEILSRRPDMFAAAFPICGGGRPGSVNSYATNVDMWVFHGARDNVVFPDYSTEMVIALHQAGGSPRYTLYTEANHNSWDAAFAEPTLLEWIFSQTKQP